MADTGNGAAITFSGFTAGIVSISVGGTSIETVDVTLLSDTVQQFIANAVKQQKPISVVYSYDSSDADNFIAIDGVSTSLTVTWPGQGGTAATLIGTTFITDVTLPEFANGTWQNGTVVFQPDGLTPMAWTTEV